MKEKLFDIVTNCKDTKEMLEKVQEYINNDDNVQGTEEAKEVLNSAFDMVKDSEDAVKEKANGYAWVIKMREKEKEAITERIAALKMREKQIDNNIEYIKDNLSYNLQRLSISKLDTKDFKFSFRLQPEALIIKDPLAVIPKEFIVERLDTSIDKDKLKKAIQGGLEVVGVTVGRKASKLSIR